MILLVTPDKDRAASLRLAAGTGTEAHQIAHPEPDPADVIEFVASHEVRLAFVGPGLDIDHAHKLTRTITARFPTVGVILVDEFDDLETMRAGFRAGAADVLDLHADTDEIRAAAAHVQHHIARLCSAPAEAVSTAHNHTITCFSMRGGVGRSTIAAGLGSLLHSRHPEQVVLVDLDVQSGDIAATFALPEAQSMASLVGRSDALEPAVVKALLRTTDEGLQVMTAPPKLSEAAKVTPELVTAVLDILVQSFRYVVIDVGAHITEATLAALDLTTDLVLVGAPDAPSVRGLSRSLAALDELGIEMPKRHLVINKATERYGLSARKIEAVAGLDAVAEVAASREIAVAVNGGDRLHCTNRRSPLAKGLRPLVDLLSPDMARKGALGGLGLRR